MQSTRNILRGNHSPLVTLCVYGRIDSTTGQKEVGRGMGFVCEKLQDDLYLVITCAHNFLNFDKYNRGFTVAMQKQNMPHILEVLTGPIKSKDFGLDVDVAWLVVRIPNTTHVELLNIKQSDPLPVACGTVMYNASAHTVNPFTYSFAPLILEQTVSEEEKRIAFANTSDAYIEYFNVRHPDYVKIARLKKEGWTRHRMINMVSRSGCSGSPIIDKHWILYGLNRQGSSPDLGIGNQVICIPTSELWKARQAIQSHIVKILAS